MKQRDDVTTLVVSNLQRLIESRGTNPSALAKQCGMGHTSVYDLVQGRIASPKISTLAMLAEALDVPISQLFLSPQELAAQSRMIAVYQSLPPEDQERIAHLVEAWKR